MTWREIIDKASAFLAAQNVPDATVAAELLAARLLSCTRGFLANFLAKEILPKQTDAMRRAMKRLVAGEPLQYILGEWDFRSLTLACDRRALIPRPETEELVTRVLRYLRETESAQSAPRVLIDVGTGTGAIALSIAKEYAHDLHILATDVSEDALALAKENACRCGLDTRVKFLAMDGLDDFDEPNFVDVLVSNPPYIESRVCETLDPRVKDFEPRLALDGGADGLVFYDRYLADALNILKPGGAVFFEIGEDQGECIRALMSDYGFTQIKIEKDFANHDRYASAILP